MTEETTVRHESFAMLAFRRVSRSGSVPLFGSSIPHSHTIRLTIRAGEVSRRLHADWYRGAGPEYIEVEMSYTQFAEAISAMNVGDGVPVTIRHVAGKRMAEPPAANTRAQFEAETRAGLQRIAHTLDSLVAQAEVLCEETAPGKGRRKQLLDALLAVRQDIGANLSFVAQMWGEQMDRTVTEAKGEFEALVTHTIQSLGLQALKAQDFRLLTSGKGEDTEA